MGQLSSTNLSNEPLLAALPKFEAKYKRLKKTLVIERRNFKICEVKEREIGFIKKRVLYIHFDGRVFSVLQVTNSGEISGYRLNPPMPL